MALVHTITFDFIQVYLKPFPQSFAGAPFSEIALLVFEQLGATLFAMEIVAPGIEPRIVLNPGNFILPDVRCVTSHDVEGCTDGELLAIHTCDH